MENELSCVFTERAVVVAVRTEGAADSKNLGFYVQDSWSVLPNLTLNIGVRTEKEEVPNYGAKVDPTLPKNAIEFNYGDKVAPRVGFAWDVMSDQKVKVYGSWGTYYDITKLEMPRGSFGGDKWLDQRRLEQSVPGSRRAAGHPRPPSPHRPA